MNEQEALSRMIAPGTPRKGKYRNGVIQIHITRACDKSCFGCTQGSNLAGKVTFISPQQFEQALLSLKGWWGVVGVFGGNPALHPQFELLCDLLAVYFPREQRGLWCNHPLGKGSIMRRTFDPNVSNLNVHLDEDAYKEFKDTWPESMPFGLTQDSRHSPPYVAMKDVLKVQCPECGGHGDNDAGCRHGFCKRCGGSGHVYDESKAWELISNCDINQHWSAMIGVFRGELRAWFCEIAGAQSILHQDEPDYPDTGLDPTLLFFGLPWWKLHMKAFATQVRKHCHECGVPLRGYGELAQSSSSQAREQVSMTHASIYKPKRKGRAVELVTVQSQLGQPLDKFTTYLQNSNK